MESKQQEAVVAAPDEALVRNEFARLDKDGDGKLTSTELVEGMKSLRLPYTDAHVQALLARMDRDRDGGITLEEFQQFVEERTRELRLLFDELDTNHNGALELEEVERALHLMGMKHDEEEVRALFRRIDANGNGEIDFGEWRQFLLMVPETNREAVFKYWKQALIVGGDVEGIVSPALAERKTSSAIHMLCGATATALAKTSTAPLERLKIIYQLQTERPPSVTQVFRDIWKNGGLRGFFRGNLVNILKSSPESAVKFAVFERSKQWFSLYSSQNGTSSSSKKESTLAGWQLFVAGGVGGIAAHASCYPLEVIKTRLCGAPDGTYRGAGDVIRKIMAHEGYIRPFYRGLSTVLISTFPHSGVALMTYDLSKTLVSRLAPSSATSSSPSVLPLLFCATSSTLAGTLISHPLHVVKSRLIMQGVAAHQHHHLPGGHTAMERHYTGLVDCLRQTYNGEGIKGFYRGFLPSLVKGIPSHCITYVFYECAKHYLHLETKHKKH
ncbi:Mitochondrial carrier [Balamuthia mandrillaris]